MSRMHLFEFEDQKWFPGFIRNYMTDFLQFLSNKAKIYKGVLPQIIKAVGLSGNNTVIDLASGGGGGLLWLNEELKKTYPGIKIILTDYYPNIDAFRRTKKMSGNFEYVERSVDAKNVPSDLKGLRTMFLSFHHFKPDDAQSILQNAVNSKSPVAIFEAQGRNAASIISMLLSPLTVLLVTPFIRPFRPGRIFFTYLIPVVPICVMWDGVVSSLRTYSTDELKVITGNLKNGATFKWDIDSVRSGPGTITYLIGTPS